MTIDQDKIQIDLQFDDTAIKSENLKNDHDSTLTTNIILRNPYKTCNTATDDWMLFSEYLITLPLSNAIDQRFH